tara:strand:- start:24 stop:764 length:741 start_codon:yes stop_codon:yes gene_type:complete
MKLIKLTFLSLIYITIISCSTTISTLKIVDAEKDTQIITQFDLKMSMTMAQTWATIRVFEVSQINSPFDEEALDIKNCISKLGAKNINNIKNKEFINIKEEFQNINSSLINSNIDWYITNYIEKLEVFMSYTENKMANTIYTKDNPIDDWESEINNMHKMAKGTPYKDLSNAINGYRTERNKTIGPSAQILSKYEKVIHDSTILFHMRNFISNTLNIKDIADNQNIDYYYWRSNKEKFINNSICSE